MKLEVRTVRHGSAIVSELYVDDAFVAAGTNVVTWCKDGEVPHATYSAMEEMR